MTTTAEPSSVDRPSTAVECVHCGLPVPRARIPQGGGDAFCCAGCEAVHSALAAFGLSRYYDLRQTERPGAPPAAVDRRFAELDDPDLQQSVLRPLGGDRFAVEIYLIGVHCAACVWLVESLPKVLPGVVEARLDIRRRVASVVFDRGVVALSRVAVTLASFGYDPHLWRGARRDELRRAENRRHLVRLGVAFACAGNVMLLAFALYGGAFHGMDEATRRLLRGVSLLFTTAALAFPGRVFFQGAWSSLRARVLHMDVPVALALAVGTAYGAYNTVVDAGEVYFESLTAVVFLLLIGRYLQARQRQSAEDAIELLFTAVPATARRVTDGAVEEIPIEALRVGDEVEVRSGDTAPADGELTRGSAPFDLSPLTGESKPVVRAVGERVHAGCSNLGGVVRVHVTATGAETRVGKLLALVERLAADKPPMVRLADRIAHGFVIVVLLLAAVTCAWWWWHGAAVAGIENAVSLLIVTCPCALGLATPLAIQAAIGKAARRGILIKTPESLERLTRGGRLYLDKTGTVTQGRMRVALEHGVESAIEAAAALERTVEHPIAAAVVAAAGDRIPTADDVEYVPGGGALGRVGDRRVLVGSPSFARERAVSILPDVDDAVLRVVARGESPVVVAEGGVATAVLAVGDRVREDAADAIAALARRGFQSRLLSGDDHRVVERVAAQVGVRVEDSRGDATPEEKAVEVRRAAEHGDVVMVGDGVNDAAALAAASVGVAVRGGAEASLAAADVYLSREGLTPLVELIDGARRTVAVIRRGLFASLGYNTISASLAITGHIHPLTAAVLMPISSLTVVALAWRSRTFDLAGDER